MLFGNFDKMDNKKNKSFGSYFKELRGDKGLSIKKMGSLLDINYSYISKIENDHIIPSEDFISKIVDLFNCDKEEMMLRAGKIPEDILNIIKNNPKEAAEYLRKQFADEKN